ncbi:UvrB/UvrC motif-containing protein [Planctomycetota bacterium]
MDLRSVFEEWPHHPAADDDRNVRCVRGEDGRLVIQVRARCGIFQWEYEGRPDGRRPHGFTSLLDYHRHRIEEVRGSTDPDAALRIEKAEIEEMGEELMDYYQRRVLFFRLGEYERARRDAEHNLSLMDVIRNHSEDADLILEHEKWRPFVTMDRARADAMLSCQGGDFRVGLDKLDLGIDEISDFYRRHGRPDLVPLSQEIAALKDLKTQLRETYDIPLSRTEVIAGLREEQDKAIADEDYERAARIRDEISRFERGDSADAI